MCLLYLLKWSKDLPRFCSVLRSASINKCIYMVYCYFTLCMCMCMFV